MAETTVPKRHPRKKEKSPVHKTNDRPLYAHDVDTLHDITLALEGLRSLLAAVNDQAAIDALDIAALMQPWTERLHDLRDSLSRRMSEKGGAQ